MVRAALVLAAGWAAWDGMTARVDAQTTGTVRQPMTDPVVTDLIAAHNRERAQHNHSPLKAEPKLMEAARLHARDMAEHSKMAHEGSDGSTPAQRVARQDYHYLKTGENVAFGQPTVKDVMRSWMNSPGHRENILTPDFAEIGVARVADAKGEPYWCAVFGNPMPMLDPTQAATDVVKRLNLERIRLKLAPMTVSPALAKAAQAEARAMADRKGLQREDKNTTDPIDRIRREGYRFREVAQILGAGQPTPEAALRSLMENSDQKSSLMGNFVDIGVGYATAKDGIPYWCLFLAKPSR